MRRWAALAVAGLAACGSGPVDTPDDPSVTDADGDGAPASRDCDDDDASRYPGNTEVCDGVDNDCDGLTDLRDPDLDGSTLVTWYADRDGDGFGAEALAPSCTAPERSAEVPGDCNDDDPRVHPDADEVCNGIDDDCDQLVDDDDTLAPNANRTWYPDADGDGFGVDAGAFEACDPPVPASGAGGDCDDDDATVRPGAPETCNGRDDDCDGSRDEGDAWWDGRWPYRLPVSVVVPAGAPIPALPLALDLDLAAALGTLGDRSGLDPASVRLVLPGCASPPLPADWADALGPVLDAADWTSPPGDGRGALLARWDTDGDRRTAEAPTAGSTVTVHVYFGSTASSPGVPPPSAAGGPAVTRTASTVTVGTDASTADLSLAKGGLVSRLALAGRTANLANQTAGIGNGLRLVDGASAAWLLARDGTATVTTLHDGAVAAVVRTSGSVASPLGAFDFVYDWAMFDGRPELWARVRYTATRTARLTGSPSWTAAVVPWLTNNAGLLALGPADSSVDSGDAWVQATYATTSLPLGLFAGWRVAPRDLGTPLHDPTGGPNAGRFVGLVGQDLAQAVARTYDVRAGDVLVDDAVFVLRPYAGAWSAVRAESLALLDAGAVTPRRPERRP